MEENKELSAIRGLVETAELLLESSGEYQKTVNVIVGNALRISGADRVCLIIRNKKDQLVIKAGAPSDAHGIGQTVTPETGERFLRQVMDNEAIVLVTIPSQDKRVSYMSDLVLTHGISSILFLPLFSEREPVGILVFDWLGGRRFSREVSEGIKIFGRLAGKAIGMVYRGRKEQERILQDEKMRILGEQSSQIAHIIRNSLLVIGGFSERLAKYLWEEKNSGEAAFGQELFDYVSESAGIIDKETKKLERIVNDVLTYSSLKKPVMETSDINDFLRKELPRMVTGAYRVILKPSKRLDGVNMVFDRKMLLICLADLVRYAVESSATKVVIKTKLKPKQREVVISVINNGRQINPHIIKDIFSPFVTAEIDGTGLALANVQSIVRCHGGNICVLSGDMTEFRITLPLTKPEARNSTAALEG
jgi:signal transduction histidine kinase